MSYSSRNWDKKVLFPRRHGYKPDVWSNDNNVIFPIAFLAWECVEIKDVAYTLDNLFDAGSWHQMACMFCATPYMLLLLSSWPEYRFQLCSVLCLVAVCKCTNLQYDTRLRMYFAYDFTRVEGLKEVFFFSKSYLLVQCNIALTRAERGPQPTSVDWKGPGGGVHLPVQLPS